VKLFPWQKPKEFFNEHEKAAVLAAIRAAEMQTSGEVRVFVESKCKYVDAIDRAQELFAQLQMQQTAERNGVIVYVAVKDKQVAVFGDEGIHQKVGEKYWNDEVSKMLLYFKKGNVAEGLQECINDIGEALKFYFPYNSQTDKNELPDDIVFGR
jgi:uncharacterized membrane protein